jgi:hypothetical protein
MTTKQNPVNLLGRNLRNFFWRYSHFLRLFIPLPVRVTFPWPSFFYYSVVLYVAYLTPRPAYCIHMVEYTACPKRNFAGIILAFQENTTLLTTNHKYKVTKKLYKLFIFLFTTLRAQFKLPDHWLVNKIVFPWKRTKFSLEQAMYAHRGSTGIALLFL